MNFSPDLSEAFIKRISGTFGEAGKSWLEELPVLLQECFREWSLIPEDSPDCLTFNYVLFVRRENGEELVLKAGVPNHELSSEIEALKVYAGEGAVKLLDSDADRGFLLMERMQPGEMLLEESDDEKATAVIINVMRRLWKKPPAGHHFRSVRDWGRGFENLRREFNGGSGPFPENLLSRAESLFAELCDSMDPDVVLHGDLHHWNVLRNGNEWLAIDPKGILGEPAYEIGAWMRNPDGRLLKMPGLKGIQKRRIEQFASELGFERCRLRDWCFAQELLSAWWGYEDDTGGLEQNFALAEIFQGIKW